MDRPVIWSFEGGVQPALTEVGLRGEITPHEPSTKDLLSTDGKPRMPVYTRQAEDRHRSGRVGQMRNVCSGERKRDVVRRYVRSLGYGPEGRRAVVNWLGISRDEAGRTADLRSAAGTDRSGS